MSELERSIDKRVQDLQEALRRERAERERLEQALRRHEEELGGTKKSQAEQAARVAAVTRDFEEAKRRADDSARAKRDFLANISHELRTPMNGVIGMTDLLLNTELSREQRRFVETIRNSGRALLELLNDILDYAKIENKRILVQPAPFDLCSLTDEVVSAVATRAEEKGLALAIRHGRGVPRKVIGDYGRVRQVLTNLVDNAVKFTPKGHVLVGLECLECGVDRATFRFAVADTGIGIPQDKTAVIFDKFTQVDTSTSRQYGGTGLGLAIANQLALLMGGSLAVESVEHQGSTFFFTLPLPLDSHAAEAPAPLDHLAGLRVLVVDGQAVYRRVLQEQLGEWGMAAATAETAGEAVQRLRDAGTRSGAFQVLLVNHRLPDEDGESFARTVCATSAPGRMSVVLMTPAGWKGDEEGLRHAGIAGRVGIPIRRDELASALSEAWKASRSGVAVVRTVAGAAQKGPEPFVSKFERLNGRVLVVEDDVVNQEVAVLITSTLGCKADVASDGREALVMLEKQTYDAVFMDCQMPEMDGYEATAEIRRREGARRHTPIIALTAHAMPGDRERCLAAGMDAYLSKPVQPGTVLAELKRWLPLQEPAASSGGGLQDGLGEERRDAKPAPPTALAAKGTGEAKEPPGGGLRDDAVEEKPLLDIQGALGRMGNNRDLYRKVLDVFVRDIPQQVQGLEHALRQRDLDSVGRRAHTMKGACAAVGAEALRSVAHAIEAAGKSGDVDAAVALLGTLNEKFSRFQRRLREMDGEAAT